MFLEIIILVFHDHHYIRLAGSKNYCNDVPSDIHKACFATHEKNAG